MHLVERALLLLAHAAASTTLVVSVPALSRIDAVEDAGGQATLLAGGQLRTPMGLALSAAPFIAGVDKAMLEQSTHVLLVADPGARSIFALGVTYGPAAAAGAAAAAPAVTASTGLTVVVAAVTARFVAVDEATGAIYFSAEDRGVVQRLAPGAAAPEQVLEAPLPSGLSVTGPFVVVGSKSVPGHLTATRVPPLSPGDTALASFVQVGFASKLGTSLRMSRVRRAAAQAAAATEVTSSSVIKMAKTDAKVYGVCSGAGLTFFCEERSIVRGALLRNMKANSALSPPVAPGVFAKDLVEPRGCAVAGWALYVADKEGSIKRYPAALAHRVVVGEATATPGTLIATVRGAYGIAAVDSNAASALLAATAAGAVFTALLAAL